MNKLYFIFFSLIFSFSFGSAQNNTEYIKGDVPSDCKNVYNNFITKNLKNIKYPGSGNPQEFEIKYATIGKYPVIFSNEISGLNDLESRYMDYRNNRYNDKKSFYHERVLQKQQQIQNIFNDLSENPSNKEFLILLGVMTCKNDTKDKWVIIINPENPENDWSGWNIDAYTQKNTALILTSADGNVIEFLNTPYRDFDILADRYENPMYKFILEPLYDNKAKVNPFPF